MIAMKIKRIEFSGKDTAEIKEYDLCMSPAEGQVLVRTLFSTISPGTERAIITDAHNCPCTPGVFPRYAGYSSSGIVTEVGEGVSSVRVNDRVLMYWSTHSQYNLLPEKQVIKIPDNVSSEDAALAFISTFPLAAIRKCRLEIGESAMVMGCGLLGQFAVKLLRLSGAAPIIAVDPVEERREEAIRSGADHVFDPMISGFDAEVKEKTSGGVNVVIEVTGVGAGLDEALDCTARFGRIALLGCTRDSDFSIDYYNKIHKPGITLIGAHTNARPGVDSYSGWFTQNDDIECVLKLLSMGRIEYGSMRKTPFFSPEDCGEVYQQIISNRSFPTVAQFDWRGFD